MEPSRYHIVVRQGKTLRRTFTWRNPDKTPVNLTGYSAEMQVRDEKSSTTPVLDLSTTPSGGITLGGLRGTITIRAETAAISPGAYVYDLFVIQPDTARLLLLEGDFDVY